MCYRRIIAQLGQVSVEDCAEVSMRLAEEFRALVKLLQVTESTAGQHQVNGLDTAAFGDLAVV